MLAPEHQYSKNLVVQGGQPGGIGGNELETILENCSLIENDNPLNELILAKSNLESQLTQPKSKKVVGQKKVV